MSTTTRSNNVKWAVEQIKDFIAQSEEMETTANESGSLEAAAWARGRKDGLELAMTLMRSMGISFNEPGTIYNWDGKEK